MHRQTRVENAKSSKLQALEKSTNSAQNVANLNWWLKIISVSVITLVAFETIAVSTALPFVVEELHGLHLYALASGIAMATQLITTVLAGPWCDARGPKPIFYGGTTLFVFGLAIETFAPTIHILVFGRAIQGFGGGLILVPLYVMIAKFVEARQQPAFSQLLPLHGFYRHWSVR